MNSVTVINCKSESFGAKRRGIYVPAHAWDPNLPAVIDWRRRIEGR